MSLNFTDSRVLIGIAIFLIIIGGMALDPVVRLLFFIISGIVALGAVIKSKGRVKVMVIILLAISLVLSISAYQKAKTHMETYKKSVEGIKK